MTTVVHLVGAKVEVQFVATASGTSTLEVTTPDGTVVAPAPTVSSDGATFTSSFTPAVPGRYTLLWSGPDESKHADIVDVWPSAPRYLVSIGDAIERLQAEREYGRMPKEFAALGLYIATATSIIEDVTGPLIPATKVWRTSGRSRKRSVVLPHVGIVVTDVTVDGTALADSAYTVDEVAGIVFSDYLTDGDVNIVITYTVGSTLTPPQARLACLEVVTHLWQIARGGQSEAGQMGETVTTPMGFALPKRAWEMVQSIPKIAGLA